MVTNVLALLALLGLTSCATLTRDAASTYMDDVDVPLSELRSTLVAQLPVGLAYGSPNGRELTSKYFIPGPAGTYKPGGEAAERFVAHVTLLGDHRPWDVEVRVTVERRTLSGRAIRYVGYGPDQRLTKQLVDRFRVELSKRREDRNVVDDFRVF